DLPHASVALQTDALGEIALDQILARRTRAELEIASARDLHMAGLRMDHGFAELVDEIVDEAAAQDEAGDADGDRGERQGGTPLVPVDVARREAEQNLSVHGARPPRSPCVKLSTPGKHWR